MIKFKGRILSWLLRLQRLTWRVHIEGRGHLCRLYAAEKHFMLCFWHGKYVPILPLLEGYEACVITSSSERGNIIAEICKNFAYQSARIPDQPWHNSLQLMMEILSASQAVAVAVDGPLGPQHRVKSSLIWIASSFGFYLLPVSVDSRRKIVFNKRWDRMEIPLPFTKVCLIIGEPIKVTPELRLRQVQYWADNLTEAIAKLNKKAENIALRAGVQKECQKDFDR